MGLVPGSLGIDPPCASRPLPALPGIGGRGVARRTRGREHRTCERSRAPIGRRPPQNLAARHRSTHRPTAGADRLPARARSVAYADDRISRRVAGETGLTKIGPKLDRRSLSNAPASGPGIWLVPAIFLNRGDWIRTSDRPAPSRVRYQTAPLPVVGGDSTPTAESGRRGSNPFLELGRLPCSR
jgi:hypothetical protein